MPDLDQMLDAAWAMLTYIRLGNIDDAVMRGEARC